MTYPQRFKQALELAGMTQTELADAIGVKKQTVNSQLIAERKREDRELSASNSAKAARAMSVDHYWLATGEGEPRPVLHMERLALSEKAVYIGDRFDAIDDDRLRDKAYALILQMLDFSGGGDPPNR